MPLLKAKLAYNELAIGERFTLLADDPAAGPDLQRWADRVGATLRVSSEQPLTVEVEKTGA